MFFTLFTDVTVRVCFDASDACHFFAVHGIGNVDDLDDDEFQEKLRMMEEELDKIAEKPAYDLVKSRCPGYVYDKKFRRMFLRSQDFDPAKAAHVMVTHFETKRMVYGDGEILCRDVRQSDLNEVDMEFLRTGALQVIPSRDAAGRMIFCMADLNKASRHESEIAMVSACRYNDPRTSCNIPSVFTFVPPARADATTILYWNESLS